MQIECYGRIVIITSNHNDDGLNIMQTVRIINCQALSFSEKLSEDRIARALTSFRANTIRRLLGFALYLLGLNRQDIGNSLDLPPETVKSMIKAIMTGGVDALEDRRRRASIRMPRVCPQPPPVALKQEGTFTIVDLGIPDRRLKLDQGDPLQLRTVLLTMLNSGLLSTRQVAQAIGLTPQHTMSLAQQLLKKGAHSLLDKREGQKQEYRVTPEIKAELIQQFAVDVITGGATSGIAISDQLKERCRINIPARTVRHHLGKLGLPKIKHSLPQLVAAVKKTSKNGV